MNFVEDICMVPMTKYETQLLVDGLLDDRNFSGFYLDKYYFGTLCLRCRLGNVTLDGQINCTGKLLSTYVENHMDFDSFKQMIKKFDYLKVVDINNKRVYESGETWL